jgi:hypothetical protein
MSSPLEIMGWLAIGLGAGLAVRPLQTLLRRSRSSQMTAARAWSEVRLGLTLASSGLGWLGTVTHGTVAWLAIIPVSAMVIINLAVLAGSRIRRTRGMPPGEA